MYNYTSIGEKGYEFFTVIKGFLCLFVFIYQFLKGSAYCLIPDPNFDKNKLVKKSTLNYIQEAENENKCK